MVTNKVVLEFVPFLAWVKGLKVSGLVLPSEYKSIKRQIRHYSTKEYGNIVLLDVCILANEIWANDTQRFEAFYSALERETGFTRLDGFTSGTFYVKV
jgi:hypothetical protein